MGDQYQVVGTKSLDHLGIVAAAFKDFGFWKKINSRLPSKDPLKTSERGGRNFGDGNQWFRIYFTSIVSNSSVF